MKRVLSLNRSCWKRGPLAVSPAVVIASKYQLATAVSAGRHSYAPTLGILSSAITRKWFSDSKSKSPTADEDAVMDQDIPKVQSHPASDLKFSRDLYTVPVTIRMPDISDTNDNSIEEWFKKPGDVIKRDDVLCDISTPDFTFGMSMDDETDALMGEILVEAGIHVADGTAICVVYHPEETKSSAKEEEETKKEETNV